MMSELLLISALVPRAIALKIQEDVPGTWTLEKLPPKFINPKTRGKSNE
ncbi:MAG: hypothetical protein GVY04_19330 [Cyanobacteria bacterium]|jgi:hypothetical protein|nr:hypothetical protein [Cyanobacteria bacterium GSL.Bin1]